MILIILVNKSRRKTMLSEEFCNSVQIFPTMYMIIIVSRGKPKYFVQHLTTREDSLKLIRPCCMSIPFR